MKNNMRKQHKLDEEWGNEYQPKDKSSRNSKNQNRAKKRSYGDDDDEG